MADLPKFRIVQTHPTLPLGRIYMDGHQIAHVCRYTINSEVGKVKTVTLELLAGEITMEIEFKEDSDSTADIASELN